MKKWIWVMIGFVSCKSQNRLIIQEQGSYMVGGTVVSAPGKFHLEEAMNPQGQTLHADHAYAFYQIPSKAKLHRLVFLHGAGQSKKTWETTPDGREGFQNIFLRKGYPVFLVDQPRRGEAGRSSVSENVVAAPDEGFWFTQFRLGNYPDFFPNVQFDPKGLEQFFRQMTPNTGPFDAKVIVSAMHKLLDQIRGGVLITHSQSGGIGWELAINDSNLQGIVSFEPYSGFIFPKGEKPDDISSSGLFGPLKAKEVSTDEFMKLTKMPILIYYGDNIAEVPSKEWNKDHWRSGLLMAQKFVDTINKYGGKATLVHLPKVGIYGNTHFPFSDLNNQIIADHMHHWLSTNQLN